MPDLLTLDTKALLDNSEVGRAAAEELEKRWAKVSAKDEGQKALALQELEGKRFMLRKALIERARPIVERLAKKKKAKWVMEAQAVLWGDREDITKEVIAEVDAQGTLAVI
ncbi:MAG: OmpH family outer membrane protein [Myxococcaceae bacterium]|nr:OmpH family outer membrane protein [Myxococcaceae bacterium]